MKTRNPFIEIKAGWCRVKGNLRATIERMRAQDYHDDAISDDLIASIPSDLLPVLHARLAQIMTDRVEGKPVETKDASKPASPLDVEKSESENEAETNSGKDDFYASDQVSKVIPPQPLESDTCGTFFEKNCNSDIEEIHI